MTATLTPTPTIRVPTGLARRAWAGVKSAADWLFGAVAVGFGLAILSAVPLAQFLVLGYFLEASGRVARTGRLRDGFVGVRRASRLGGAAIGIALTWLPLLAVSTFAANAQIIDPGGVVARRWQVALTVLSVLYALHVLAACLRGGRLWYFFWPFNFVWLLRRIWRGGFYRESRDAAYDAVVALRLPYYFSLGLRGYAGAFVWLVLPLTLLGRGHEQPGVAILGGLMFTVVVLYVPFLQARFARDNRLRSAFAWRSARRDFRRAPVAFALAFTVTLTAAVPLYLMKIEAIPRELVFLESLAFMAFGLPARWVMGWAYSRAARRDTPRHWTVCWLCRLLMLPVAAAYAVVVFTSQHVGWGGVSSLFEQHAFLLPVPFTRFGE